MRGRRSSNTGRRQAKRREGQSRNGILALTRQGCLLCRGPLPPADAAAAAAADEPRAAGCASAAPWLRPHAHARLARAVRVRLPGQSDEGEGERRESSPSKLKFVGPLPVPLWLSTKIASYYVRRAPLLFCHASEATLRVPSWNTRTPR
jgi:hypothetical protein